MNRLGGMARGAVAGAAATLAMDAFLYRRFRKGGGAQRFLGWESSAGIETWEAAPAPARAAKRLLEGATRREIPEQHVRALNNATHWAYGIFAGMQYGAVVGGQRWPKLRYGPPFGAIVWASGYAVLPAMGVYRPIWEYDRLTLWKDFSAHIVFGAATAVAFRALSARTLES